MFAGPSDYAHRNYNSNGDEGPPMKRPRNNSITDRYRDPALAEVPPGGENVRNEQQDMVLARRLLDKDKNRRLSCKECRRSVSLFYSEAFIP